MKRSVFILLCGIFSLSSMVAQENPYVPFVPKEGKALVVIIRPYKLIGRAYKFPFGVNNKVFCILDNKQYGFTNIAPGKNLINGSKFIDGSYELTLSQDKSLNLDMNSDHSNEIMNDKIFEAGKIYYYKAVCGLGSISIYARLEEITEEEALKLLKPCKLSEKNNDMIE